MSLIFDIETCGLPDVELAALCPACELPPRPGDFDPSTVAVGNLKDPAKISEKIDKAREAHNAAAAGYDQHCRTLAEQHFADFKARAALEATTGRVLAIGYRDADSGKAGIDDGKGSESEILATFWQKYVKCRGGQRKLIGCNILQFDLPFLVRRSWILGVDVPASVRNGRYFDGLFVDLRELWLLGQRWGDCDSKLDTIARALGCGGKPDGVSGADFGRLWLGTAEEKQQAVSYLLNDLEMTAKVASRLGVA